MKFKTISKRIISAMLVALMLMSCGIVNIIAGGIDMAETGANVDLAATGASVTGGEILYLNNGGIGLWAADNAWFSAYFFGTSGSKFVKMTNVTGNYYRVTAPSGTWESVIFVRHNPSSSNLDWNSKWNQTNDLSIQTNKNLYTITGWGSDKSTGSWSTYQETSNASLTPSASSVSTGTEVTFTAKLTSNASYNELKSVGSYSVSPAGATVTSDGKFTATAAGTYTVSATVTYNVKGFTSITKTASVSTTVTVTENKYSYTVTAGEGGTVSPTSGSATSTEGVTITATPNAGYTFEKWTVTNGSVTNATSASTTFKPTANGATATASFTKNSYDVSFIDSLDNSILWSGKVEHGATPTAPDYKTHEGYDFIGWEPSVGAVTGDTTYIATYALKEYTVTASGSPAAGGTVTSSSATVKHGESVTLKAEPDTVKGYIFSGWTFSDDNEFEYVSGDADSETITIAPTSNITATANFTQLATYTVQTKSNIDGAGAISPVEYTGPEGSKVTLTAQPNAGYKFVRWEFEGTYSSTDPTTSPAMDIIPQTDVTATAVFEANKATVSFVASSGGSVNNTGGEVTYPNTISSTATPNEGYHFVSWSVQGGTEGTDYITTVEGTTVTIKPITDGLTITATANFAINTYTVDFVGFEGAELGSQTVEHGKNASAPAAPEVKGYTFKGWSPALGAITADTTFTAQYEANTYTVTVNANNGGTATGSGTVTYPNTATLTATPSGEYVFTGWQIEGTYETVSGDKTKTTFEIRPLSNITATATFAEGQKVVVYSYSENGYKKLTITESNGTTTNTVVDEKQATTQNINGATWDVSNELEFTPGYGSNVTAVLSGDNANETVIYVDFSNAGANWASGHYLSITVDSNTSKPINTANTSGANTYVPQNDIWIGAGELVSGSTYKWVIPAGNVDTLMANGFTVWSNSTQQNYDKIWSVDASHVAYSTTYNTYTISSTLTHNNDRNTDCFTLTAASNTVSKSDNIDLTTTLYADGAWAGVTEVWITEDGKVTLRRDLLDLIDDTTAAYNGGVNAEDYTPETWNAFVETYGTAYSASASRTITQTELDTVQSALDTAFKALKKQAYFTVTINQTNGLGTLTFDNNSVTEATQSFDVVQNSKPAMVINPPQGYYIKSVTGWIEFENKTSLAGTIPVVTENCEINIVYAPNPVVSATQNGAEGTVTIDGKESPVTVNTYGTSVNVSIQAPQFFYIAGITVNGNSVYSESNEGFTAHSFTIDNITANTEVEVTYLPRTTYTVQILPYDSQGGIIKVNGEAVPEAGTTITVLQGETVTVTAETKYGYSVKSWTVDGTADGNGTTYTFSNILANHTIGVEWEKLATVDVTVAVKPGGAGTSEGKSGVTTITNSGTNTMTILKLDQVELKAEITDGCYDFAGWDIQGNYEIVSGSVNDLTFTIKPTGNIKASATFTKTKKAIYLKNEAGWSTVNIYYWKDGGSAGSEWPGVAMDSYGKIDGVNSYVYYVPLDFDRVIFNNGSNQTGNLDMSVNNLFSNGSSSPSVMIDEGVYLYGQWNGKTNELSASNKFDNNGDGTYSFTLDVNSTADGYIYVVPMDNDKQMWQATTANNEVNGQVLSQQGAFTASPKYVKILIDKDDFNKHYEVIFTFNSNTREFSWEVVESGALITIIGTDGRGANIKDVATVTVTDRVGKTYFDKDTVKRVTSFSLYEQATANAGTPVTFYTQVKKNTATGNYDYYVAGWVLNGTQFIKATSVGNGLYTGSYVFTQDSDIVPVYFHTSDWLSTNGKYTVTVYAVMDNTIANWNKYMAAYTWDKNTTNTYEQFGPYAGQLMIPVAGLDGVYYTYVEYEKDDNGNATGVAGILFNNYAPGDKSKHDTIVNPTGILQTYDYYEFVALLEDGKENITFVIKHTNDRYNKDIVKEESITSFNKADWDFVPYTDYSNLKTDIFGTNIENIYSTLSDADALYIIQAGDKNYQNSDAVVNGQYQVESYLFNSNGEYLGKCVSYELHDKDAAIWSKLGEYIGQKVYISYEALSGQRYDGEWYGDANVSVTINVGVDVALTSDGGKTFAKNTAADKNIADYGKAYINGSNQNVDVTRGEEIDISATPLTGYRFIGWFSEKGVLFSENPHEVLTSATGTTYTAVFEKLESGYFYVNHYIYQGNGTADNVPKAHGGSAQLYVGIENVTDKTSVKLALGNTAYIKATEGDKLVITIATDAIGSDKFFAWYVDAVNKYNLTTFEEVGVDSDDNIYNNNGTVVGRNDMVYYQFEYTVGKTFSINLYSDLTQVSDKIVLEYEYYDRYNNLEKYYVSYELSDQEILGFAGNNNTPMTPAYITSSNGDWDNTILKYAPFVSDFYKDVVWTITEASYDTLTFKLRASQSDKLYTATLQSGNTVLVNQVKYGELLEADAEVIFPETAGKKGFWYNDVNSNGVYDDGTDIILTYSSLYAYRITTDMVMGYELTDSYDFDIQIDAPVYGREQTSDDEGNNVSDLIYVDFVVNVLTPFFYGEDNEFEQWYNGELVKDEFWGGGHVTIEALEKAGYEIEYGLIMEQVGSFKTTEDGGKYADFDAAYEAAVNAGMGTASSDERISDVANTYLVDNKKSTNTVGFVDGDKTKYYYAYSATNQPTNVNRVLMTMVYKNTATNRGKYYNVYGFLMVKDPDGNVRYFISNVQEMYFYPTATGQAPVVDGTIVV